MTVEERLTELEKALATAMRRDYRRLKIPAAARELGMSVEEVEDLIEANVLPVCNATSKPRIPMEDAARILRERFTIRERAA